MCTWPTNFWIYYPEKWRPNSSWIIWQLFLPWFQAKFTEPCLGGIMAWVKHRAQPTMKGTGWENWLLSFSHLCNDVSIKSCLFVIQLHNWTLHHEAWRQWCTPTFKSMKITTLVILISVCYYLEQCNNVLLRSSTFTNESSIGSLDIIDYKWLCLVKYYILMKLL